MRERTISNSSTSRTVRLALFVTLLGLLTAAAAALEPADALFGRVTGVADDDALNVRARPELRAPKLGAIPPYATVGIRKCRRRGRSLWCEIFPLAQNGYDGPAGWVNARYLKLSDRGYVLIDGWGKCDYALSCSRGFCDVVTAYYGAGAIHAVDRQRIARSRLRAAGRFEALEKNGEGYCSGEERILDWLAKHPGGYRFGDDPAWRRLTEALWHLDPGQPGALAPYIHPRRGLTLSYFPRFGPEVDRHFTPEDFVRSDRKKILWSVTEGKGEEIRLSLSGFLRTLPRELDRLRERRRIEVPRELNCRKCRAYVIYWYERPREEDPGWQGLVAVLAPWQGQWYLIALRRDYWTI
jgi:uncharacterized protein YraI